jgi:hypothetical protein
MRGVDWSDTEIDLTVADYFQMLMQELAGIEYNKSAHRRALLSQLDRPEGAIEFKHQNISAILLGLGHPWIEGYKPASNYQAALTCPPTFIQLRLEPRRHFRPHGQVKQGAA